MIKLSDRPLDNFWSIAKRVAKGGRIIMIVEDPTWIPEELAAAVVECLAVEETSTAARVAGRHARTVELHARTAEPHARTAELHAKTVEPHAKTNGPVDASQRGRAQKPTTLLEKGKRRIHQNRRKNRHHPRSFMWALIMSGNGSSLKHLLLQNQKELRKDMK